MNKFSKIFSLGFLLYVNLFHFDMVSGSPVKDGERTVQEMTTSAIIKNLDIFTGDNGLVPLSSETAEKNLQTDGIIEVGRKLRRKKRFILSAAAIGAQAWRNQILRWQNRLEKMRLRNERYKANNDLKLQKLHYQNEMNSKQLDKWKFNQQLNWQKHQQRWTQINRQMYPMNYVQYMQMQHQFKPQTFPPSNFQQGPQHPFPNTSTTPTSTTITTSTPANVLFG